MNLTRQIDEQMRAKQELPVICDIVAEAYGASDLRREIVLGTTANKGTTIDEYERRMKDTMKPLTTYLDQQKIPYQVNILQGTVLIQKKHERLLDTLYEHEPKIASTTRRLGKGEIFREVKTMEEVKMYS